MGQMEIFDKNFLLAGVSIGNEVSYVKELLVSPADSERSEAGSVRRTIPEAKRSGVVRQAENKYLFIIARRLSDVSLPDVSGIRRRTCRMAIQHLFVFARSEMMKQSLYVGP
jgi:hypothetical protein